MGPFVKFHIILLLCVTAGISFAADPLKSAIDTELGAQKDTIQSQERIDEIADQTRDIVQEYRGLLRSIDGLTSYNRQLSKLVKKQEENLTSIKRQLGHIEETQRDIVPLMLRMIGVLDEFIQLDMPFLKQERTNRLNVIKEMMDRPDVTLPDKFRRIMEAYQIEMEYGRTIEAYNDTIEINGQSQTVDVLRVGRIALLYLTLDRHESGYWNPDSKQWALLEQDYTRNIQQGIKIARKQSPPDLFKLPVQAPGKAQ